MRKFLIVLLFLIACGVVAADIVLRGVAEDLASERIVQTGATDEAHVAIGGWAFLPQVITGEYERIVITADSASAAGMTIEQIEVSATGVEAPLSELLAQPLLVAGQVEGSFVVPYSYFGSRLPEGVSFSTEGGEPRISGELALPGTGRSVPVTAGGEFTVDGDVVALTPVDVQAGDGSLDAGPVAEGMLSFDFETPELPFGLSLTDMETASNGLRITGVGQDVSLAGSEAA
ncbi:DUF2993 domain-containing protein [Nocardiopsis sp. CNT312]|uniref:LmeA family phospholipid-binding protein n=1 Tax=Nocardiopsis sp. CNT312 TaxID=1137268 RepID=UPI00048D7DAD|nr:DUF2993 domain-containing protein [Nocardiopsis sp. CNT312]